MKYSAHVHNQPGEHRVNVKTGNNIQSLSIAPKEQGGSSINGGELFFLALATCYCNDIYREAAKMGIQVDLVEVDVKGEFNAPGQPGSNIVYRARVKANASEEQIRALMLHTDSIAEIHKTVRLGTPIKLELEPPLI